MESRPGAICQSKRTKRYCTLIHKEASRQAAREEVKARDRRRRATAGHRQDACERLLGHIEPRAAESRLQEPSRRTLWPALCHGTVAEAQPTGPQRRARSTPAAINPASRPVRTLREGRALPERILHCSLQYSTVQYFSIKKTWPPRREEM